MDQSRGSGDGGRWSGERAERRQKFPKALPFLVLFSSNHADRGGPDVASLARLSMSNPITIILAPQFCLVWDCCRSRQRGSARNTGHAGSWQVRRRLGVDARRTIEFVNSPTPPSSALSAAFHRRLVSVTSSPLALAPVRLCDLHVTEVAHFPSNASPVEPVENPIATTSGQDLLSNA